MSWQIALQQVEHGPKIGYRLSSNTRTCTICGETKALDLFYEYTTTAWLISRRHTCTACFRKRKNIKARARYYSRKNSTTGAPSHTAATHAATTKGTRRSGKTTPAPR